MSLATQEVADERMAHLLQESYASTRALLARNRALLDSLTQRLLAHPAPPSNGNGAVPSGPEAAVWRSDGAAGTLSGEEVRKCAAVLPQLAEWAALGLHAAEGCGQLPVLAPTEAHVCSARCSSSCSSWATQKMSGAWSKNALRSCERAASGRHLAWQVPLVAEFRPPAASAAAFNV